MRIRGWFLLLIILVLSGCATESCYPEPIGIAGSEASDEVMQGLEKTVEMILQYEHDANRDLQELQQLKVSTEQYRRSESFSPSYAEARIELLTEDDVAAALDKLVREGYLSAASNDAQAVISALAAYQRQQQLPVSGQFDSATIRHLQGES
ncbi:MAG: peptidoglycan-binding protein [Syntrophomonadaceae bacterium]